MRIVFLAALSLVLGSAKAHARWMNEGEAAAHFDEINTEIHIHKDLSLEVTQELSAVVDKQAAIEDLSNFRVVYSPATAQAKILAARVIIGNRVFLVDPKLLSDQPAPDQKGGYDQQREIRVVFPQMAVGATIELTIWRKENQAMPGVISTVIPFTNTYPIKSQHLKLEADTAVAWKLHDPFHELKLTEGKAKHGLKLEISSDKTVYHQLADEPFTAFAEPQTPMLYLGSNWSWSELGNRISAEYDKVLSQPLPDELRKIVDPLKSKEDKFEQVELALTELRKELHFLGTWQTSGGQYFPKSLKDTVASRFADCQDYAAVTIAVLHALGNEAHVAWTAVDAAAPSAPAGSHPRIVQFQPPVTGLYFNHAIVKAKIAGKDYWFDPASPVSYVRGIAAHLAGTYALVLKTGDSKMEMIPFATAEENQIEATRFITVNNDKTIDELVRSKVKGFVSSFMNASDVKDEDKSLREADDSVAELLDKASPLAKAPKGETWVDHAHGGGDPGGSSPTGTALKFDAPKDFGPFTQDPAKVSGGVLFALPTKQTLTTVIQGGTVSGALPKECTIDTKFFKLSRTFSQDCTVVRVKESSEIKQAFIPEADMHGPEIKKAKEALEACWTNATLVFQSDGLVDPSFKYNHKEPWKLTSLQLETEKVKKEIPKLWSKITGKTAGDKAFYYSPVWAEWSKSKTSAQVKAKAAELINDWTGQDVKPLVVKMLMLEQIQKTPKDPELLAYIAIAELEAGFVKTDVYEDKAIERARLAAYAALELGPKNAAANRALAQVLIAAKDSSMSDAAKYALSLEPGSEFGMSTLARAYLKGANPRKALEAMGTAEDYPLREAIYMALEDSEKVAATYEAELKKKPSAWAYINFATYENNHGQVDKAIELAKKALEFRDFSLAHRTLSDAYVHKGSETMDKTKKIEDGLEWLGKALLEDPSNVLAHQIVGSILIQRGRETKDERLQALGTQHVQIAGRLERAAADRMPASAPEPTATITAKPAPAPKGASAPVPGH